MIKHTLSNFEEALTDLKSSVSKMGGLTEKLCKDGLSAFISSNEDMVDNCNQQDKIIDAAERSINNQTVKLLALQAPMAIDLRMIISSLQIATCLERCGDYGRNLARRSDLMLSEASPSLSSGMKRLGDTAILSLHNSLNAHATGNVELAKQICSDDTEIDKIYLSIFSKLIKEIRDVPDERITQVSQMFLSAKNIERIGDQATNIAELIIFAETGEFIEDTRVKIDESSL